MSTRIRFLLPLLTFFMGVSLFAGCNIFSFAGDEEKTPIQKAEQDIRDGFYKEAMLELADSTGALKDSTDAMAIYTYSKARILQSGLKITEIVDLVQSNKGQSSTGSLSLLTKLDQMEIDEPGKQTAWYKANMDINQKLTSIWNDTARGDLQKTDIALDYTVSSILSGVLSLRDTNGDGFINSNDFQINLDAIKTGTLDGFAFSGVTSKSGASFPGLTAFLGKTGKLATGPAEGIPGYTPDDINRLINIFLTLLETGEDSLVELGKSNTTLSPDEIKTYIHQIASIINFYWYNDGINNDGDKKPDGTDKIDEETIDGEDEDGDGLIDEDTGNPSVPKNTNYVNMFNKWNSR